MFDKLSRGGWFYRQKGLKNADTENKKWTGYFKATFAVKVKVEGAPLLRQLVWRFSYLSHSLFLRRLDKQLSFHLVTRHFSKSDSIFVWSIGPDAAQSRPVASYTFYLTLASAPQYLRLESSACSQSQVWGLVWDNLQADFSQTCDPKHLLGLVTVWWLGTGNVRQPEVQETSTDTIRHLLTWERGPDCLHLFCYPSEYLSAHISQGC